MQWTQTHNQDRMIDFKQLCELLTADQQFEYFNFPREYFAYLDEEDYDLICIDTLRVDFKDSLTVIYPASKWYKTLDWVEQRQREWDERVRLEKIRLEKGKEIEERNKPKSSCCGVNIHYYKRKDEVTLVCMKCFKVCKPI
jgi:hypothetical protein